MLSITSVSSSPLLTTSQLHISAAHQGKRVATCSTDAPRRIQLRNVTSRHQRCALQYAAKKVVGRRKVWVGCAAAGGASESAERSATDSALFTRCQVSTFLAITLGYAVYYMTRLSFTYVAPTMVQDLGMDITTIGVISSVFPMTYAWSKILGGILGDLFSPRQVFALGLLVAGMLNCAFGLSSSLFAFCVLWGINGVFQGTATPQCAKLMTNWLPLSIRGRWWAVWNMSHNLGGFLIPIIAGSLALHYGWRYGMFVPGLLSIACAGLTFWAITDSPQSVGLQPVDTQLTTPVVKEESSSQTASTSKSPVLSIMLAIMKRPTMWLLGIAYFFIYGVRAGVVNWSHFYLLELGAPNPAQAAILASGFEVGGLVGNLSAGFLSDWYVKQTSKGGGIAGKRVQVCTFYAFGTLLSLLILWLIPGPAGAMHWWAIFLLGHFIYGPQLLVALIATDISPKTSVATANGFIGWLAYFGATASGYPLSVAVKSFGWSTWLLLLGAGTVAQLVLLLPLWNLRSIEQESEAAN